MDDVIEKVDWLGKVDDALLEMVPATELYVETAAMMLWLGPVLKAVTVVIFLLVAAFSVIWAIRFFNALDKLSNEKRDQFYKIRELEAEYKEMEKLMVQYKQKASERMSSIDVLKLDRDEWEKRALAAEEILEGIEEMKENTSL